MALDIGTAVAYLTLDLTAFNSGIEAVNGTLQQLTDSVESSAFSLSDTLQSVGQLAYNVGSNLTQTLTTPIVNFAQSAVDSGREFDATMSKVRAIAGLAGEENEETFQKLRASAIEMGRQTKFTAEESAEALVYMGMAGWDAEQMLAGLPGILSLAAADGADLGTTSDIVTDALTAFGMQADEAGYFADLLATASTNANTNVTMMGESFKYIAPVAGALGYSAKDVATNLGIMANSGIKASQAGTSLRGALAAMANPSDKAKAGMEALGISLTDSSGQMYTLEQLTDNLRVAFGDLTEAEKVEYAALIFGRTAMSGMLALINAAPEDMNEFRATMDDVSGAADNMAAVMLDNLDGSITLLQSSIEALYIKISDILVPVLRDIVDQLREVVEWFLQLDEEQLEFILQIAGVVAAVGPALMIFGKMASGLGSIIKGFELIGGLGGMVVEAFQRFGDVMKITTGPQDLMVKGLSKIYDLFFDFSMGAPMGLVIAGIALLAAGFVKAFQDSEEFRQSVAQLFDILKRLFEDIWGIIKEVWEVLKPILDFVIEVVSQLWQAILPPLVDMIDSILQILEDTFIPIIKLILDVLQAIAEFLGPILMPVLQVAIDIFGALLEAVAWVIGVIADFVHGFVDGFEDLGETLDSFFEKAGEFFQGIWDWFLELGSNIAQWLSDVISSVFDFFADIFDNAIEFFSNIWNSIVEFFTKYGDKISSFFSDVINKVVEWVGNIFGKIGEFFGNVWDKMTEFFGKYGEKIANFFSDIFGKLGEWVGNLFSKIGEFFSNVWDKITEFFGKYGDKISSFFSDVFGKLGEWLGNMFSNIWEFFGNVWSNIVEFFGNVFGFIGDAVSWIWDKITGFFGDTIGRFVSFVGDFIGNLVNFIAGIFGHIGDLLSGLWGKIGDWFNGLFDWFGNLPRKFFDIGASIFSGLWDGLKSVWDKLTGWISDGISWLAGKIDKILPGFSSGNMFGNLFGSHAAGLDYVPFDGYMAQLHEGERVLTKQEAEQYNRGEMGGGKGDTFNFYNTKPDPYEYARQMKRAKREMAFG